MANAQGGSCAASLRRLATWGVALRDTVAIHSTTPARHLGIRAELTVGARADLLMLDPNLRLHGVLRAGILQPGSALTDAGAVPP